MMELKSMRNDGSALDTDSFTRALEESNLPLQECLEDKSKLLLAICGMNWSKRPFYLPIIWSGFIVFSIFAFYSFTSLSVFSNRSSAAGILFCLALIIQSIALIFSIRHSHERINQSVKRIDLFLFTSASRTALISFSSFIVISVPLFLLLLLPTPTVYRSIWYLGVANTIWGLLCTSAVLSVNLLFLIVDAKSSVTLITSLMGQEAVSAEQYYLIKEEIDGRVSKHSLNNSIVMGVALSNVVIVFLMFIASENVVSQYSLIPYVLAIMSREVLYALIGFWFVALVNEKSCELAKSLSQKALMDDIESRKRRMEMCVISTADPISFPLAGMILQRKDIFFRFLIWLTGLFIGIVRQKF